MTIDKFIVESLTKLPPHLSTLACSALGFLFVHQVGAPLLSRRWFPVAFGSKSQAAKNNWSTHVASQVNAVIIVPLALWVILNADPLRAMDRAYWWDDRVGFVHAIAAGYFLWDLFDALLNFIDVGFVLHAVLCFLVYLMSFRPFVAYYGVRCLLLETSTLFLNLHWFLDKTGRTGTRVQLVNGILLLSSFFTARLVYGGIISYQFTQTLLEVHIETPLVYLWVYGAANVLLQALNIIWFSKMIAALKRRFSGGGR